MRRVGRGLKGRSCASSAAAPVQRPWEFGLGCERFLQNRRSSPGHTRDFMKTIVSASTARNCDVSVAWTHSNKPESYYFPQHWSSPRRRDRHPKPNIILSVLPRNRFSCRVSDTYSCTFLSRFFGRQLRHETEPSANLLTSSFDMVSDENSREHRFGGSWMEAR